MLQLIVQKGTKVISTLPLKEQLIRVGSSAKVDLQLNKKDVSALHAEIYFQDGDYHIKDLNSDQGTFINCDKIQEARILQINDIVNIGQFSIFIEQISEQAMDAGLPEADRTVMDQEIRIPSAAKQSPGAGSIFNRLIINIREKLIYKIAVGFVVFLLLFVILLMMMPTEDPYWEELKTFYSQGQYEEALKIAEQVLDSDPNNEQYLDAIEKIKKEISAKDTLNLEGLVLLLDSDNPEELKQAVTGLEKMFAREPEKKELENYLLEAREKSKIY